MSHFESLADSRIQHDPVHSTIHPDSADKEILLFNLLQRQSEVTGLMWKVLRSDTHKKDNNKIKNTYIFKNS